MVHSNFAHSLNMLLLAFLSVFVLHAAAAVTWTATPFNPASIPLAVRSPYLSAWLNQGGGTALNEDWPKFWTGTVSRLTEIHTRMFSWEPRC